MAKTERGERTDRLTQIKAGFIDAILALATASDELVEPDELEDLLRTEEADDGVWPWGPGVNVLVVDVKHVRFALPV